MTQPLIRTLVVGGAGFIGSHLVRLLVKDGRRAVTVAGRRANPPVNFPSSVTYVSADVADEAQLLPLLAATDEIIDLAYSTVPKTSYDDPIHDVLANLPATVNLLRRSSEFPLRRVLLVSSGGTVYGNARWLPIDETHPTNPVSPYGITKLAAEKYALMFHRLTDLPVIIARPGNPYGPLQFGRLSQGFIGAALHAAFNKGTVQVFGERGTVRDYIHIDDLCRGLLAALDHGTPGDIFNIGTGLGHDNRAVLDLLTGIVRRNGCELSVEARPARGFDVAENVLSSARLTFISGWRPSIELEAGLQSTWDWVRSEAATQ